MDKERVALERMVGIEEYRQRIVDILEGRTPELQAIPRERLDWSGTSAFLFWYDGLLGKDRDSAIKAMGRIIEGGTQNPATIAQVVNLAMSLGLNQLEPNVKKLQKTPVAEIDFVKREIVRFFAPLELNRYFQEKVRQGELP